MSNRVYTSLSSTIDLTVAPAIDDGLLLQRTAMASPVRALLFS